MRRVGARRKIGGKALASGSDGCVFDVRFLPDGSIQNVEGIVSKVFPKERANVAKNEFAILQEVNRVIPDGKGVVAGNPELKTISDMKDDATSKAKSDFGLNACARIVNQKQKGESPFYVLEYPRIDGSLSERRGDRLPLEAFDDAIVAVQKLSAEGLIHMDIAARNVFVKDNKCLIGDFGNMINISDENNLTSAIKGYLDKHMIKTIGDCLSDGDVTSTARIAMLMYVSDDLPTLKSEMLGHTQQFRNGTYAFSDLYYDGDARAHAILHASLTQEMKVYLDEMGKIENKNVIKAIMLHELKQSDIRMLAIVMLERGEKSESMNNKVVELWGNVHSWFPVYLGARLSALRGSRRTRRKRVKMSRKHK